MMMITYDMIQMIMVPMAILTSPCRPTSVLEEPNPQPPSVAGRLRLAFRATKDGIIEFPWMDPG